ncbi:coatomer subunit delta [Gurleya vavrai]
MISAFLSYNKENKDILFKPFSKNISTHQQSLVYSFQNTILKTKEMNDNLFELDNYFIAYINIKESLYSLISTSETQNTEMLHILNHIKPLLNDNFFDVNFIISEIFPLTKNFNKTIYNLIPLENLRTILNAESNDEKTYENMMKSKELEKYNKIKEMKKGKVDNAIDKQLEKVRNLEIEMRNEQLKQLEAIKNKTEPVKKKINKQRINVEHDFLVTIKEKINVVIDKEMNIKECFINGDLSVKVRKEELRKELIKIKKKMGDIKCSPNIDKEKFKENVLFSEKGYPLNKNVALLKWKRKADLPFDFSFWVSETNENKNSIQFEVDCKKELKDLLFYFKKNKGVSVENSKIVDDKIEWNGKNKNVEILCDNYEDIFDVNVDFWSENFNSLVDVLEDEKIKVVKIFEVEKFEIVYN